MKLKVLHLIESLGPGGAERLLYTNLKHLDRDVLEHAVVTIFSDGGFWKEPIEKLGVSVTSLNCSSIRDIGRGVIRLRRILRKTKPDLIHTHLWTANIIGRMAGRLSGIPVISSIHNPDYEPEALEDGSNVHPIKKFSVKILDTVTASFGCARMIAVSDYTRKSTIDRLHFPSHKIDLVYNPIDVGEFDNKFVPDKEQFLSDHGLPGNAIVLLNVGRVTPQKGLIYAIRALAELADEFPNVYLVSLGGQNDKIWFERVKTEVDGLGLSERVLFLGAKRNVHEFLVNSDIFVFPSLHEGLGIALIEAMATGLACVASDTGPIPELIEDGVNGVLVPSRDPHAIAVEIRKLLADGKKRASLGKAARKTALERFQPKEAVEKLTEVYFSVAHHT